MPNVGQYRKLIGSGIVYDPDALLYFSQLTGTLSPLFKYSINKFVIKLKNDGNWTNLERLWLHATESQQHARVSIVNPSSTQITEVNSPSWTALLGYTGDGASSYLNSNYNPTGSTIFTQNSASQFVYSRTNTATTTVEIGHSDATTKSFVVVRSASNQTSTPLNMSTGIGSPTPGNNNGLGLFHSIRTSNANTAIYRNGSSLGTTTIASIGVPNNNLYIGADNLDGVPSLFSAKQISLSGVGSGSLNQTTFYDAVNLLSMNLGFTA